MTDDSTEPAARRTGDVVLEQVRGELALLKQATELGGRATDNAIAALAEQIKRLEVKFDTVTAAVTTANTEPGASASGRQILEKIAAQDRTIAEHEAAIEAFKTFQTTVLTSFKTFRAQMAVGGFVLGVVSGVTAVVTALQ